MAIVVIGDELTAKNVKSARKDYPEYIKITADIEQEIVVIGGEYHADAEKLLLENYSSLQKDIWGGGYNIATDNFETNAIINLRAGRNGSTEILDPEIRDRFLEIAKKKLGSINKFVSLR